VKDGVDFTTFVYPCDEFVPKLDREHDSYIWARPRDVLPRDSREDRR
jgi:hypothetical protein